VLIDSTVEPKLLKQNLERLVSNEQIFCPIGCKDALSEKVDWTRSDVIFYQGDLWLIDNSRTLQTASLEPVKGKITLVVEGQLTLSRELDPTLFGKVVDKIHNLGAIRCPTELMQALKAKMGISEGDISDTNHAKHESAEEEVKDETTYKSFVNVPYVAL
jgi:hypothetical protein